MGERGNVFVVQAGDRGLYLYSHWSGGSLPEIVQAALARARQLWTDEAYLARVIFSQVTEGIEKDLFGAGISVRMDDNEHPIVVVDSSKQQVGYAEPGQEPKTYRSWSFAEFLTLTPAALYEGFEKEDPPADPAQLENIQKARRERMEEATRCVEKIVRGSAVVGEDLQEYLDNFVSFQAEERDLATRALVERYGSGLSKAERESLLRSSGQALKFLKRVQPKG